MPPVASPPRPPPAATQARRLRHQNGTPRPEGHAARAARRFAIFVAGDAAVLFLVTTVFAAIGEHGLAGAGAARALADLLPGSEVPGAEITCGILLCLLLTDSYEPVSHRQLAGRRIAAASLGLALPYWAYVWDAFDPVLLAGFLILTAIYSSGLLMGRELVERISPLAAAGRDPVPLLLVAYPHEVERVRRHPALGDRREYAIRGVFNPEHLRRRSAARESLSLAIRQSGADTVVLCGGALTDQAFDAVQDAALACGCQLMGLGRMRLVPGAEPRVAWSRGVPLLLLTRPTWRLSRLVLKRGLDLAGALAGLILLAPVMTLIALAIRLDGPGPILFAHRRVGLGGRPFRCYKFRSMRIDAEEVLKRDPVLYAGYVQNDFKLPKDADPRITRVGRILRETSLDELPQLWNVLCGDMSLVGPRPIVPEELAEYGDSAQLLLSVKPGLAGAWAVNGRSEVRYPARADLELGYIRQWRVKLDLWLLAKLFPTVISRRGSH